jgi:Flp pilus assembly protein TadB
MIFFLLFLILAGAVYFVISGTFTEIRPTITQTDLVSKAQVNPVNIFIQKTAAIINKPFQGLPYLKGLQQNAEFLRITFGAMEILLFKELLLIAGAIIFAIIFSPLFAIVGAFIGFVLPDFILAGKVRTKKELIEKVFPETVDLLDLCIGAGLDFLTSLRWVIDKSVKNPFIEQLEVVLNEIRIGKSRSEALKDMAKRVKISDISSFSRTIIQAERMGISIEEALRRLSEDTRDLRFQRGERYAIKASLKILAPLIFCILPVILIVVAGPIIIKFSQGDLLSGIAGPGEKNQATSQTEQSVSE